MSNRFLKFLEEIASTDWEYGDGTPMAGDARKHLDEFYRIAELEQQLAEKDKQLFEENLQVKRLEQQLARYQSKYNNLLAVAHRDGGQYLARHGEEKAGEDAITEILTAYHNNDRYQGGVEVDGYRHCKHCGDPQDISSECQNCDTEDPPQRVRVLIMKEVE